MRSSSWRALAACRGQGPAAFYADDTRPARAICETCPVRQECLDEADYFGTWGGVTEAERRRGRGLERRRASVGHGEPAGYNRHVRAKVAHGYRVEVSLGPR